MPRLLSAAIVSLVITLSANVAAQSANLIVAHQLPLNVAKLGAGAAREKCRAAGQVVTVAIVTREGGLQALERSDGAGVQTVQSAINKAITSAVFGVDSGFWVDRAERGEEISPLLNHLPNLILARGGAVVAVEGEIIAGIAVAGGRPGKMDEICAHAGVEAISSALEQAR